MKTKFDACWKRIGVWRTGPEVCPELEKIIHCNNCHKYSEAGKIILNREIEDEYLTEWSKIISQPRTEVDNDLISVLIFRIGDEWYAIPNKIVKEITHCDKHHSLPHRKNNVLRGLVNIRGELLLCVSLGYLFELNKSDKKEPLKMNPIERYIVIEDDSEIFVFPVSEVKNTFRYNPKEVRLVPSTAQNIDSLYLTGLIHYQDNNIGVLNSEALIDALRKNVS